MGNGNFVQTSFLGGEWSPLAQGRMTDPRYSTALNTCLNAYPIEEGAWTRRSGFRMAGLTRNGAPAAVLSFEFKEAATYNVELTDDHLRVFAGTDLVTNDSATVTNISTATPAVVTVGAAVDWASDDQVLFLFGSNADKAACFNLGNRVFNAIMVDTTHLSLHDPVTGKAIDGSTLGWASGLDINVSRVLDLDSPYTEGGWASVRSVQSEEDEVLLTHDVRPYRLTVMDGPDFELNPVNFLDGPYLDAVTGSLATPSATSGVISVTLSFDAYSATKAYKEGDFVSSVSVGYRSLQDANVGHTPASSPTYWEVVSPGAAVGDNGFTQNDIGRLIRLFSAGTTWSWGRITALATTGAINASQTGYVQFGNMVSGGGIAALFDGDYSKPTADCALKSGTGLQQGYAGINATTAPTTVSSVIIYPNDAGEFGGSQHTSPDRISFRLYASNTEPTSYSDGTLLDTRDAPAPSTPVTLTSSDVATTWNYIWAVILRDGSSLTTNIKLIASQMQFFDASGSPGSGVNVEILGDTLASTAACIWRLGAYGGDKGYPTCGVWAKGRLWLSGAIDNRFDASKSNDPYNMAPTTAAGAVGDSNAISYTLNSDDVNPIFWLEPNAQGIIAGTQGGEWLIAATTANAAITPTNIQADRITKYKCANAKPVTIGLSTVFIQRAKRNILEYVSDAYSGKFFGPNLNELSRHLTKGGIEEICAQDGLTPIVWCRRADGAIVGATYRRVSMHSSEPAKFLGWHRHTLGSNYKTTSISKAPSGDGLSDGIALITRDPETDVHYVEMLSTFFDEDNEIYDAMFLDNAVVPIAGASVTVSDVDCIRFYGLHNLEGKTVTVFAAGVDCGGFPVASGYVTVPLTGLFTIERMNELTVAGVEFGADNNLAVPIDGGKFIIPAAVGYSYSSRGQLLRPFKMEDTGARAGVAFGKSRRIHDYAMLLHKTQGLYVGTDFSLLKPALFRTPGGTAYTATQLYSGIHDDTMNDKNSTDGMSAWEITRPYPATVVAAGGFLQTQDK